MSAFNASITQLRYRHAYGRTKILLVSVAVGVASQIEPGPRPSLAVMRRGQQAGPPHAHKRRAACRSETRRSLQESAAVRSNREIRAAEESSFEASGEGSIFSDSSRASTNASIGFRTQSRFLHIRNGRPFDGLERPVRSVFPQRRLRARIDPGSDTGDLGGSKRLAHRWHLESRFVAADPFHQAALGRVALRQPLRRSSIPSARRNRCRVATRPSADRRHDMPSSSSPKPAVHHG